MDRILRSVAFLFIRKPAKFLVVAGLLLTSAAWVEAGQQILTLPTRSVSWQERVTLSYVLITPDDKPVKSILLVVPGGNGVITPRYKDPTEVTYDMTKSSFSRLVPDIVSRGVAIALPDMPTDLKNGISFKGRSHPYHMEDLGNVLKDLKKRFPGVKAFVAGGGSGSFSALSFGAAEETLGGIILMGMESAQLYVRKLPRTKMPVLALHHIEDGCSASPYIEAKAIAEKGSYTLVTFRGGGPDRDPDPCSVLAVHGLVRLENMAAAIVTDWMEKGAAETEPAPPDAKMFLNEHVFRIPIDKTSKNVTLQTTVFKPDGPGPFPLIVLSHGVNTLMAQTGDLKARLRYTTASKIFVDWGFVVAIPMRRGYGASDGGPNWARSTDDFGLEDAKEIQAAIDFMSQQTYVDPSQTVLVGESGGGLASLAYGSLKKADVKGIVNFAGGLRSTAPRWEFDMAYAFKTYAKTTKAESIWFYAENDQTFPKDVVQEAFKAYQKNGGRAELVTPPPFKRDGHSLFSDPAGIEIWRDKTLKFLRRIGIKIPENEKDEKAQTRVDT